jgi:predicted metal-dependent peptidase
MDIGRNCDGFCATRKKWLEEMFTIDDNDSIIRKEAIFIDASGSIDLTMVAKHLVLWEAALRQYPNDFEVHLTCFDERKIYNIMIITKSNISDILTYKAVGGGGSDLPPCWKYMKEHDMDNGLIFTDGYIGFGNDPGLEVYFLIHSGKANKPPYGTVNYI